MILNLREWKLIGYESFGRWEVLRFFVSILIGINYHITRVEKEKKLISTSN